MSEPSPRMAGWGSLLTATKWHYFTVDGRSLCGRWFARLPAFELEQGNDDSPDNCAACRQRLATQRAQEAPAS